MAMIGRLFENINTLLNRDKGVGSASADTDVTYASVGEQASTRQAVYPEWYFNSKIGQPRKIDPRTIRNFAQSPWVQMVQNTFKKQVYSMEWEIRKNDQEDETDYSEKVKKVKDFLNHVNSNGQKIQDLNTEVITDLAELDAGVWNLVYTSDSYELGDIPVYDSYGRVIKTELGLKLKPLGQRKLSQIKSVDGASMLKQVDIYKNILAFYQYSFKHPHQNPTMFENPEVAYMMMNPRPYSVYGFSPVQSVQQVLELLIQGTRYNKDIFTNNAIPDILATLPKLPEEQLKKLKRVWNNQYKGKPHQIGFVNFPIENFHKLANTNRDMEWLEGQKWYFKIVFAAFGVSPTEAGFFENSNKSNDEGQERVTVRNALEPYLKLIENHINSKIIPEILQEENPEICFKFVTRDKVAEKIEFEQDIKQIEMNIMTINEFRRKNGMNDVEWGDKPQNQFSGFGFGDSNPTQNLPNEEDKKKEESKLKSNKKEKMLLSQKSKNEIIEQGEDMIDQAKTYDEFLTALFDSFEKKVMKEITEDNLLKSYTQKNFGKLLQNLFNVVNTREFVTRVKRFLKLDLKAGLESAEDELNVDIGFTEAYEQKLAKLYSQQIDGYTINGKKWFGIKGATKELQAQVIKTVQNSVDKNYTIDQTREEVKQVFGEFKDWRAEMIARTETNRIVNEGKLLGYKESKLNGGKVIKVALDNRTSCICRRLSQKYKSTPIDLDEQFFDNDTNKAFMTPPFHINCRTTIAFVPKK